MTHLESIASSAVFTFKCCSLFHYILISIACLFYIERRGLFLCWFFLFVMVVDILALPKEGGFLYIIIYLLFRYEQLLRWRHLLSFASLHLEGLQGTLSMSYKFQFRLYKYLEMLTLAGSSHSGFQFRGINNMFYVNIHIRNFFLFHTTLFLKLLRLLSKFVPCTCQIDCEV